MAFPPQRPPLQSVGPRGEITQSTIQKMLDENHQLIMTIVDYQSKGMFERVINLTLITVIELFTVNFNNLQIYQIKASLFYYNFSQVNLKSAQSTKACYIAISFI